MATIHSIFDRNILVSGSCLVDIQGLKCFPTNAWGVLKGLFGEIPLKVGRQNHSRNKTDIETNILFIGNPGCGKTQAQIRMLIGRINQGAEVYWINPHYTLYHPEDQPTDLRPIKDKFRQVGDYEDIVVALAEMRSLVRERMVAYRNGDPVGNRVVLVIDELPAIADVCGKRTIADLVSILREGRKTKVFVIAASQDALTETLGMKSGARNLFQTVFLAWNTDQHSWRAFSSEPKPKGRLPLGKWYNPSGETVEIGGGYATPKKRIRKDR